MVAQAIEEVRSNRAMGMKTLVRLSRTTKVEGSEFAEEEEISMQGVQAWDDVSGSILDPCKVRQARLQELTYIYIYI